ncbi:MAG: 5'-deoxynucleotidase [Candidatus Fimadaptatus sp.]
MSNNFFAYISRMKLIRRWGLMRNTQPENDMEHSMQVVMLAHGMGAIANRRFGARVDLGRIALLAAYHDASEVITGDLATPIKYFNPDIKRSFHAIEDIACDKLASMLPDDLRGDYLPLLRPDTDSREWRIVKAADKLSAYLKCLEELKAGNAEFARARETIAAQLADIDLPELREFMREFGASFELTLDELD